MLTLQVQVRCEACKGRGGATRTIWYEDKFTYSREHMTDWCDCEACGGKGHTMQTITLDETAIQQLAKAVMAQMPKAVRHSTGVRTI